jgi:hypothetical protein
VNASSHNLDRFRVDFAAPGLIGNAGVVLPVRRCSFSFALVAVINSLSRPAASGRSDRLSRGHPPLRPRARVADQLTGELLHPGLQI